LTILKAALNHCRHEGLVASGDAWQQVKAFREVDSARLRYLSDDEARRLVNACRPDFRILVTAALLTGCRFAELTTAVTEDFNADSGTLLIRTSKSGKLVAYSYPMKDPYSSLNIRSESRAPCCLLRPTASLGQRPINNARS
jgi:integrase